MMRLSMTWIFFSLVTLSAGVSTGQIGLDVRMSVVEEALGFIEGASLSPISRAALLRAGAVRVCGDDFSRPGCQTPGAALPQGDAVGPDAERAYRAILESALAAESIRSGGGFDKAAFERYVVDGMVDSLRDPASFFVSPSVYKKIASIPADFVGFGMRLVLGSDDLVIAAVHDGSPAQAAGLVSGVRIIGVSGHKVTGYQRPVALAALWGADGPAVSLEVVDKIGRRRTVPLSYSPWTFQSSSTVRLGGVAVLRIRYLERGVETVLSGVLADPQVSGLILDMRDAGGGDEATAVAVADLLLGDASMGGKRTRLGLGAKTWKTTAGSPGERLDLPLAVLINDHTTGLAELLAAALKVGRGILVGQRTAGRLTQETLRPLADGSAVQVTSMAFTGPADADLSGGVSPQVRSTRPDVLELAASILTQAVGPSQEQLVAAAKALVAARAKTP